MKLEEFIHQFLLPPDGFTKNEVFCLGSGKYSSLPYRVKEVIDNAPYSVEDKGYITRLHDVLMAGKLADNVYFSTALYDLTWVKRDPNRPRPQGMYRRKRNATRWIAFCADDVGTKISPDKFRNVPSTFITETSPENYQNVFVFEEPIEDLKLAEAFLHQARDLGLTDAGGLQVTKMIRLPTGINTKDKYKKAGTPWRVRLAARDGKRWKLMELAAALGMDVQRLAVRRTASIGRAAPNVVDMTNTLHAASVKVRDAERQSHMWGKKILTELLSSEMLNCEPDDVEQFAHDGKGFIPIKCPWAHEHTGAGQEDGAKDAGFSPVEFGDEEHCDENQFHCQHDHCVGRTAAQFKQWALRKGWIDEDDFEAVEPPSFDFVLNDLMSFYCINSQDGKVYDMRRPGNPGVNTKICREFIFSPWVREKVSVFTAWATNEYHVVVHGLAYAPGEKAQWVGKDQVKRLNTWMRPERVPMTCSDSVRGVLDAHFENGTNDGEQNRLLRAFIASSIVHPEHRLRFAMIWHSAHFGIGKGMIGQLVNRLIGQTNYRSITAHEFLSSQFNAWLSGCTFLEIPEFKIAGNPGPRRDIFVVYDRIKQYITEPIVEINTKFGATEQRTTHCNFYLCTNHGDAMMVREDDRRIAVVTGARAPLGVDHYMALGEILECEGKLKQALAYFNEVDLADGAWIRGMNAAPMTLAKQDMADVTVGPIDEAVDALLDAGRDELIWPSILLTVAVREFCEGLPGAEYVAKLSNAKVMLHASTRLRSWEMVSSGRQRRKRIQNKLVAYWAKAGQEESAQGLAILGEISKALDSYWPDTLSAITAWITQDRMPRG